MTEDVPNPAAPIDGQFRRSKLTAVFEVPRFNTDGDVLGHVRLVVQPDSYGLVIGVETDDSIERIAAVEHWDKLRVLVWPDTQDGDRTEVIECNAAAMLLPSTKSD